MPDGPSVDHAGAHRAAVDLLTAALFGQLRDDARSRAEFLDLTRGRR
ncbi:hypothetical protein [Nocardioides nitrophenolicus]|nr:hypothetical protein [Nocardioides nitrophenolicus]MBM7517726.1 GTP cyclohydrolase I [Nocardioides nitrophenolicus]